MIECLLRFYFNYLYNPVYDFTTARLIRYRVLHERCILALELKPGNRMLCVGLGTGNEAVSILGSTPQVEIFGVDLSETALRWARRKARRIGRPIDLRRMDARVLDFPSGSFDRILCVHLLDFVDPVDAVINEILRVLRDGGRFVATFPSAKEGAALGAGLARDAVHNALRSGKSAVGLLAELVVQIPVGLLYLPLLFRPNRKFFTREELHSLLAERGLSAITVEEDRIYQDYIVSGVKGGSRF